MLTWRINEQKREVFKEMARPQCVESQRHCTKWRYFTHCERFDFSNRLLYILVIIIINKPIPLSAPAPNVE